MIFHPKWKSLHLFGVSLCQIVDESLRYLSLFFDEAGFEMFCRNLILFILIRIFVQEEDFDVVQVLLTVALFSHLQTAGSYSPVALR